MEATLTVTTKGQVTLRRSLLRHLGVQPGDRIVVDLLPSGRAEIRAAGGGPIEAFFGCLPNRGKTVSIADMNQAIGEGWAAAG